MTNAVPAAPEVPTVIPLWAREPARIVGWIVTISFLVLSGLLELANDVIDFLPESWKPYVRTAAATVAAIVLVASRIQTWMTRNGVGPAGNGKDGVWSQATVGMLAKVEAAKAQTPEAIEAALAPKLRPPA